MGTEKVLVAIWLWWLKRFKLLCDYGDWNPFDHHQNPCPFYFSSFDSPLMVIEKALVTIKTPTFFSTSSFDSPWCDLNFFCCETKKMNSSSFINNLGEFFVMTWCLQISPLDVLDENHITLASIGCFKKLFISGFKIIIAPLFFNLVIPSSPNISNDDINGNKCLKIFTHKKLFNSYD